MAIRITLECGHMSMLRTQATQQGYTHDWEVFVRGVDNANIHHYVDRVVFCLHQTFSQPKRILKEPPFVLKESGYAGFNMPIHVYLKSKGDPKKFTIMYDLELLPSGPPLTNSIRHTEIINNPTDEFRRKLLKGGATIVSGSEALGEKNESKMPSMIGKPKLSGSETKKHKAAESKISDSFAELFGTPLKPTKVSQENKKPGGQPNKSFVSKPPVTTEKSEKVDKQPKVKHSPYKDGKKEKLEEKKDKKVKDSSKEKDRSKDKSKRSSSPSGKSHSSPSAKRPSSPVSMKRPSSPSMPPAKRPPSPKIVKEKEIKKSMPEKEKDKNKEVSKSSLDSGKSEKRKEKKHKEDRDKERKDKYKESERSSLKEVPKAPSEKKPEKPEKSEKSEKPEKSEKGEKFEKNQEYKSTKEERKSPKPPKETEKPKEERLLRIDKSEKSDKSEKPKDGKTDKDRQKHKHKKREKKDKRDGSREREKKEKHERMKVSTEKQNNVTIVPPINPLSTLLAEMRERESSDSAPSVDDDSFSEPKLASNVKKETESSPRIVPTTPSENDKPLSLGMSEVKKEKSERNRRDKTKGSRNEERESRKRKRRSDSKGDDDHVPVKKEKDRGHSSSPPLEPVSSSQSPVAIDQKNAIHAIKDEEERNLMEQAVETNEADAEQVAPDSTNSTLVDSDAGEPPVFSEDYVSQLKDLQQKIMTLQDNQELQRVVQVIAETGQYEITKKTFDFDLCALDRRTVARLQQFFSAS